MLVAQDDPLDQYLVHHPEDLFDKPAEAAVIDPENPYVLEPHLRCAARELPIADEDHAYFGPDATGRARTDGRARRARATPRRVARRRARVAAPTGGRAGRGGQRLHDRERRHRRGDRHRRRAPRVRARSIRAPSTSTWASSSSSRSWTSSEGSPPSRPPTPTTTRRRATSPTSRSSRSSSGGSLGDVERLLRRRARDRPGRRASCASSSRRTRSWTRRSLALPPQRLETRSLWFTITGEGDREGRGHAPAARRRDPRGRARRDRADALDRDVRPVGPRRRLHAAASRHGADDDLHPRRVPGRRGDQRARLPPHRAAPRRDARDDPAVPVLRSDARRASRARSAATATSRSTSRRRPRSWRRSSGVTWG